MSGRTTVERRPADRPQSPAPPVPPPSRRPRAPGEGAGSAHGWATAPSRPC